MQKNNVSGWKEHLLHVSFILSWVASSRCWNLTSQACYAITVMLDDVRETVGESLWNHSGGLFKYGSPTSAPRLRFRKSQIFHSLHTFRHEQNEWMLHAVGERERFCSCKVTLKFVLFWVELTSYRNSTLFPLHSCLTLPNLKKKKDSSLP